MISFLGEYAPASSAPLRRSLLERPETWLWISKDSRHFGGWFAKGDGLRLGPVGSGSSFVLLDREGLVHLEVAAGSEDAIAEVVEIWRHGYLIDFRERYWRIGPRLGRSWLGTLSKNGLELVQKTRWLGHQFRPADTLDLAESSEESLYGSDELQAEYEQLASAGLFDSEQAILEPMLEGAESFLCIGSGPGREVLAIAERGLHSVGIDICARSIAAGQKIARERGLEVELHHSGINHLDLPVRFDIAWVSSNVYSCIPGQNNRIDALRQIRKHLKPGGRAVLVVWTDRGSALGRWILDEPRRWARGFLGERVPEPGDRWQKMTPEGPDWSFRHKFDDPEQVLEEARAAGLQSVSVQPGFIVVERPRRYAPRAGVVAQAHEEALVLLDVDRGSGFRLNESGRKNWQLLEEHHELDRVLGALEQAHPNIDPARIELDLMSFIDRLVDDGLLEGLA